MGTRSHLLRRGTLQVETWPRLFYTQGRVVAISAHPDD